VDHRRERDAGVGAAARHHDLAPARERLHHRPRAEVRVGGGDVLAHRGERRAVIHVVERDAAGVQLAEPAHQIVAHHRRHLERLAVELRHLEQRAAAGERVHAAAFEITRMLRSISSGSAPSTWATKSRA
jgi:hypothetical protein